MSQIQFLSDLHLETPESYDIFEVIPSAPYLALLGDIGCVKDSGYLEFITKQLSQFQIVFLLLGNHEPYHNNWSTAKKILQNLQTRIQEERTDRTLGSFVFLDQTRFDISDHVTILGCTLFSNILPEQEDHVSFGLNDFYDIEDWTVSDHSASHSSDLSWLNTQVTSISQLEPHRKILIFTHHSPTISSLASDGAHTGSKISSGFSSDLKDEICWKHENVKVWAFGHTHFNCDFEDEGNRKRVVTNQRGYYFRQAIGFDGLKTIEF